MILSIYALFDRVAGFYGQPFFLHTDGEARRAVAELVRDPNTTVGRHPADYALFRVGYWDNQLGKVESHSPEHLVNVVSLLRVQPELPLESKES